MRRIFGLGLVALALLIFAGCPLHNPIGSKNQTEEPAEANTFVLPADGISDTVRSLGGDFGFETLFPVNLSIDIDLYDPGAAALGAPALLPDGLVPVVVVLEDSDGNSIYSGVSDGDGVFSAVVNLPAAPEDIIVKLFADGFENREVTISDMVEYSAITRTMGMAMPYTDTPASTYSRDLTGLEDSDGDGVPDIYDADPNDPDTAFINNIPADGNMTIAFEDLFGRAQAGDADYNDFIAQYQITEASNADGVRVIHVSAEAIEKLAGYKHRFGIRINSFDGVAFLDGEYIDALGNTSELSGDNLTAPLEIDLFEDSRYAVGKSAWFTLTFDQEQQRGAGIEMALDDAPYNPYLYIINTGHDVHLIGEEPLSSSINPDDTFRDGEGFPWALLVPTEWNHPEETERIEDPYPRFTLWRESWGEEHTDWYNHEDDPWIPPDDNNPPTASFPPGDYQVSGAGTAGADGYYVESGTWNGAPMFLQISGTYKIFYTYLTGHPFPPPQGNFWCIDEDESTSDLLSIDYYKYGTASLPAESGWAAKAGTVPVPEVKRVPFSGSLAVGGTLTVTYDYFDADGDAEDTSSTGIRWFRCDSPDASIYDASVSEEIPGATGTSYVTDNGDLGKYMKVEIIPFDDRGGEGAPVESGASRQIGS